MNYIIHANGMSSANRDRHRSPGIISIKAFFIMKLIVILTVCFYFHSLANTKAQQVNIDVKNASFKTVVQLIQQQTGYSFAMNERFLQMAKPVTAIIKGKDLKVALPILFKEQPFGYTIDGRIISLVPKSDDDEKRIDRPSASQQNIYGRVTDSLGNPLQGVTVVVTESGRKVITDKHGQYKIVNVADGANLVFRLLSFEPLGVVVDQPEINVVLKLQYSVLDEAEVRGYYNTTKKLSTGNARTITAEDISSQPVTNPLLTLQGRVAGLSITQNTGTPGRNVQVEIRGRNSIANGNDPLFVVDGVPFSSSPLMGNYIGSSILTGTQSPLNNLNIEDIESITVLKDADATAIYGSMGANGVVLIVTKSGYNKEKVQINASFFSGFGKPTGKMDLMNTEQYLEMRKESFANSGRQPAATDYDINGTWDEGRYTDWQKVLIGNTARTSNSQLRFLGGNERTRFTFGAGYNKETTVYPGNFFDKKLSFQSSFSHKSPDNRFFTSITAGYSINENMMPVQELAKSITLPPNAPALFDDHGNLNWENETWSNPLALLNSKNRAETANYSASGILGYEFIKGLTFKGSLGFNQIGLKQDITIPLTTYVPSYADRSTLRKHYMLTNQRITWIAEPQLTYSRKIGNGMVDGLIGMTFRENLQQIVGLEASDFLNDELIENIAAGNRQIINSYDYIQYRYQAIYARVGYNWNEKYIVNLTGRRDGSSRFGPSSRFGSFGAIGAAWLLSEEPFMKDVHVIDFAKIRTSYGLTGNDQLGDYEYLSTYSVDDSGFLTNTGLVPTRLNNPDYGWESVKKFELGLDLGLFKNQLYLNVSWYRNRTGNQLVGLPLSTVTGFNTIRANLPAIVQNVGTEFEFTFQPKAKGQIRWTAAGNVSFPRNKLLSYPEFEQSNYRRRYAVGKSMYGDYRYQFDNVDPTTGLFTFKDQDSDGSITTDDMTYVEWAQKYYGGFTNNVSFKQFSLSVHLQFVHQTRPLYYIPVGALNNNTVNMLSRWQKVGDQDKWHQKFSKQWYNETSYFIESDALLVDASFIRLKNISLGYRLPQRYLKPIGLERLEFYAEGQNLLTITKYGNADPESWTGTYIPPLLMFTGGVKLTL